MGYEGATGVFVAIDGAIAGALLLVDEIRVETPRALRLLRKAGVERVVMITGDRQDVAETIGALLAVDEVLAEQRPQDKLAAIKASRSSGSTIMVGDGVNDAPALAAADVRVAMGERGAAASSEAAGVVLLVDRLDRLAEALRIAHRSRAIAIESVIGGMGLCDPCDGRRGARLSATIDRSRSSGSDRRCRYSERLAGASRRRASRGAPGAHTSGVRRSQDRTRRAQAHTRACSLHGRPSRDGTRV